MQTEAAKAAKRRYYERNKALVMARAAARPAEEKRFHKKAYKKKHPDLYRALARSRRKKHQQATPKWLSPEDKRAIRDIYINAVVASRTTGVQYVVDHIIPLRSDLVCGLHVPWNLRVITQEENLKKSNKLVDDALD